MQQVCNVLCPDGVTRKATVVSKDSPFEDHRFIAELASHTLAKPGNKGMVPAVCIWPREVPGYDAPLHKAWVGFIKAGQFVLM